MIIIAINLLSVTQEVKELKRTITQSRSEQAITVLLVVDQVTEVYVWNSDSTYKGLLKVVDKSVERGP